MKLTLLLISPCLFLNTTLSIAEPACIDYYGINLPGLQDADLEPLRNQLRKESSFFAYTDEKIDTLIKQNLATVLGSRLNQNTLLTSPSPQFLVDKITQIYEEKHNIDAALTQGRSMLSKSPSKSRMVSLIRAVNASADNISGTFSKYFFEGQNASHMIGLTSSTEQIPIFAAYLVETQRVDLELTTALNSFFLNPDPLTVDPVDLPQNSIRTLAKCLNMLSDLAEEQLSNLD